MPNAVLYGLFFHNLPHYGQATALIGPASRPWFPWDKEGDRPGDWSDEGPHDQPLPPGQEKETFTAQNEQVMLPPRGLYQLINKLQLINDHIG